MANVPAKLKPVGHYFKIAGEYSNRDVAVCYWCILYGVQKGMQIDRSSPDSKQFLTQHLSTLEQIKQQHKDDETVSNDVVASAHLEEVALKLFAYADREDRASNFNKNVVKAFYTAGHLFDVLTLFGELDGQVLQQQKYAKWKAAYIHNCLKNGETPQPGPIAGEEGFGDELEGNGGWPQVGTTTSSEPSFPVPPTSNNDVAPSPTPSANPRAASSSAPTIRKESSSLETVDLMKAQKFCKYAISALEYEDVPTAVQNLQNALQMLQASEKCEQK